MGKACNIVRFKVSKENQDQFEALFQNRERSAGEFLSALVKTGEDAYCGFSLWDSDEALVAARPELVTFLDTGRHLLTEISPELGVTDPVSGEVLILDGIDWRSGTLSEYLTDELDFNEPPEFDD